MKRYLILLLLIPFVFSDPFFNDWASYGELYNSSGNEFKVIGGSDNLDIYVNINGESISVENGTCDYLGVFEVCYLDYKVEYYDVSRDKPIYAYKISLTSNQADLDFSSSLTSRDFYQNEELEVEFNLINNGGVTATDVHYERDFDGFFLYSPNGCRISGTTISASYSIPPSETKTCRFYLKAKEAGFHNISGNLWYYDGNKQQKEDFSVIKLNVKDKEISGSLDIEKENYSVGDIFNVSLNLFNEHPSEEIGLEKMKLFFDPKLELLNSPFKSFSNGVVSFDGEILPNENKSWLFWFRALKSGNSDISIDGIYQYDDVSRTLKLNKSVLIDIGRIIVNDFSKEFVIVSGKEKFLDIIVSNPSSYNFFDVKVTVRNDFFSIDKVVNFDKISARSFKQLFPQPIKVPLINIDQNTTFDIHIHYFSSYQEIIDDDFSIKYDILAKPELFEEAISDLGDGNQFEGVGEVGSLVNSNSNKFSFVWSGWGFEGPLLIISFVLIVLILSFILYRRRRPRVEMKNLDDLMNKEDREDTEE